MRSVVVFIAYAALLGSEGARSGYWGNPPLMGDSGIRKCYSEMEKENDITHLLLETASPTNIDAFCRVYNKAASGLNLRPNSHQWRALPRWSWRMTRLKKCVADHEHHLSVSENTECLRKTRGVTIFHLNVCPPGSNITRNYKDNCHCFNRIESQLISCSYKLPVMSEHRMQNDLRRMCCALKRHRICVVEAASHRCGGEAAEVVDQIVVRYFQSQTRKCTSSHLSYCGAVELDDNWVDSEDRHKPDFETEEEDFHAEERRRHKSRGHSTAVSNKMFSIILFAILVLYVFQ
ncbi:uncharacterized protein CDAR_456031 [Caerostris darwini]|uniref:Uncharacterized protein n=1 Tax=Caerostris darwini TaxID=1538125 RepID=A0AAV4RR81_9ARAC|nr:uncharacterized protein CDAR_456031 [Caerostris darwini]